MKWIKSYIFYFRVLRELRTNYDFGLCACINYIYGAEEKNFFQNWLEREKGISMFDWAFPTTKTYYPHRKKLLKEYLKVRYGRL